MAAPDNTERDAALLALDVDWYVRKLAGTMYANPDRAGLLRSLHEARLAHPDFPESVKAISRTWLAEH